MVPKLLIVLIAYVACVHSAPVDNPYAPPSIPTSTSGQSVPVTVPTTVTVPVAYAANSGSATVTNAPEIAQSGPTSTPVSPKPDTSDTSVSPGPLPTEATPANDAINDACSSKLPQWPTPTEGYLGNFTRAAVAADNGICSEIGRNILIRGGNAVDSMIATVFCIGIMDSHSTGIGGGHLMTIYNKTTKSCLIIDGREQAPLAATRDLYGNDSKASQIGWRAVGVPGEIYGLHKAYELSGSGRIPWRDLVTPSADLAQFGYPVSGALAKAIQNQKDILLKETSLRSIFMNNQTGKLFEEGEVMRRPALARTLYDIAEAKDPIKWFYDTQADAMAAEFKANGGIITAEDFRQYRAKFGDDRPVISTKLGKDLIACGPPPPSSAAVTLSILNIIQGYNISAAKMQDADFQVDTYHKLLEAMKFAYASRTKLGDMDFVKDALSIANNITSPQFGAFVRRMTTDQAHPFEYYMQEPRYTQEDHGTSHISVMDEEGNAVSITSTVNLYFGARVRSQVTGVIWNDEMDDFSNPSIPNYFGFAPSEANYIQPKKRPQSSMSPIIIYNSTSGDVKIVAGSAGGSRIITAVAQLVMRLLWFGQNVREAVESPRLHNQLQPFQSEYEAGFPKAYLQKLTDRGQNFTTLGAFSTAATAIYRSDSGRIYANSDYRKAGGYPSGY